MFALRDKLNALNMGSFEMIGENITAETQFAYGLRIPAALGLPADAEIIYCGDYLIWYNNRTEVICADVEAVVRFFEAWRAEGSFPVGVELLGVEWPSYE